MLGRKIFRPNTLMAAIDPLTPAQGDRLAEMLDRLVQGRKIFRPNTTAAQSLGN